MAKLHAYRYKRGRGCKVKVWFLECPLFGGKIRCKNALGPRIVSAVLEVVASRRLPMYYRYGIFNP